MRLPIDDPQNPRNPRNASYQPSNTNPNAVSAINPNQQFPWPNTPNDFPMSMGNPPPMMQTSTLMLPMAPQRGLPYQSFQTQPQQPLWNSPVVTGRWLPDEQVFGPPNTQMLIPMMNPNIRWHQQPVYNIPPSYYSRSDHFSDPPLQTRPSPFIFDSSQWPTSDDDVFSNTSPTFSDVSINNQSNLTTRQNSPHISGQELSAFGQAMQMTGPDPTAVERRPNVMSPPVLSPMFSFSNPMQQTIAHEPPMMPSYRPTLGEPFTAVESQLQAMQMTGPNPLAVEGRDSQSNVMSPPALSPMFSFSDPMQHGPTAGEPPSYRPTQAGVGRPTTAMEVQLPSMSPRIERSSSIPYGLTPNDRTRPPFPSQPGDVPPLAMPQIALDGAKKSKTRLLDPPVEEPPSLRQATIMSAPQAPRQSPSMYPTSTRRASLPTSPGRIQPPQDAKSSPSAELRRLSADSFESVGSKQRRSESTSSGIDTSKRLSPRSPTSMPPLPPPSTSSSGRRKRSASSSSQRLQSPRSNSSKNVSYDEGDEDDDDEDESLMRRKKNTAAVRRFRDRKNEQWQQLQIEVDGLEASKKDLSAQIEELENGKIMAAQKEVDLRARMATLEQEITDTYRTILNRVNRIAGIDNVSPLAATGDTALITPSNTPHTSGASFNPQQLPPASSSLSSSSTSPLDEGSSQI